MDPAYEPPYKGIHEHRSRIMTRAMVEDYICLRREMFVEAVRVWHDALSLVSSWWWRWCCV